ncbi:MAG TPA: dihydroorotase, partial [Microvirga sp.]|nr:dihydroorotase [Microvirga sp.]
MTDPAQPVLIRNARLIDPASGEERRGGLLVRNGVIQDLGPTVTEAADAVVIEGRGQVLAPGLIDMRA